MPLEYRVTQGTRSVVPGSGQNFVRQFAGAGQNPHLPSGLLSLARLLIVALTVAIFGIGRAHAYALTGSHWYSTPITMQLQLGPSSGTLSDGFTSWGASAEDALAVWNSYIGTNRFAVVRDSTASIAQGNRLNNVFFSGTVYGSSWGTGVLAVTLTLSTSNSQTVECDVLFNNTLSWDSYRGALRYSGSVAVYDFHRVAIHEFGHVLGLDHPDQAGQTVTAIMNSRISNLDTVAIDDINGAQSIYGGPTVSAPVITTQPASQTITTGGNVTFTVVATSSVTPTYQWQKNGASIAGATTSSYTLRNITSADAGGYAVVVSNVGGSVTSSLATLTVNQPATPPTITTQPASQTIQAGSPATFSVVASGTSPFTYSWRKDGSPISGATQATYTLSSVQQSDAGNYTVVVTNSAGSITSSTASLTVVVVTVPAVASGPSSQTVLAGGTAVLSVTATGNPAPTYQWQKDGVNIAGATQSSLVISAALPTDAGTYAVILTNVAGSTTTAPVQLTVNYSQIINISTRGMVQGGDALSVGFALRGSAGKPVIIRGVGPALTDFLVDGALADPTLAIIAQATSQTIGTNDNWGTAGLAAADFQSVGAFPFASGSADAALKIQLLPATYSARITSTSASAGGIAMAEVYDADIKTFATRLVNVSTLGYSGAGDASLVAGFTIQGNAAKRVLVRAVGPGLAQFSVPNLLSNPRVDVYPLGQSTSVGGNDDWSGTTELATAFNSVGAFPLPTSSQDAAVILTLAPGSYTAVVSGVDGAAGYVLVEIYDLDL